MSIALPSTFKSQFGINSLGNIHVGLCRIDLAEIANLNFGSPGYLSGTADFAIDGKTIDAHAGSPEAIVAAFFGASGAHIKFSNAEASTPKLLDYLLPQNPTGYSKNMGSVSLSATVTGMSATTIATASAASFASSATVTLTGTEHTGDVVNVFVNGIETSYTTLSGDSSFTLVATHFCQQFNASPLGQYILATSALGVITLAVIAGQPPVPIQTGASPYSVTPTAFGIGYDIGQDNLFQVSVAQGMTGLTLNTDYTLDSIHGIITFLSGSSATLNTPATITASFNQSIEQTQWGGTIAMRYFRLYMSVLNPTPDVNLNPVWEVAEFYQVRPSGKYSKTVNEAGITLLDMEFDAMANINRSAGNLIGNYRTQNQQPF